MEKTLESSVSSLSLQGSESPAPAAKFYVPPHMRNVKQTSHPAPPIKKTTSDSKFDQSFKNDRSFASRENREKSFKKDPSDPFYNRPDVKPRAPRVEEQLFGSQSNSGINFDKYDDIPVDVSGNDVPDAIANFKESLLDDLIKYNIDLANYNNPTPVQRYSVGIVTAGRDLMACAQTGSGKVCLSLL